MSSHRPHCPICGWNAASPAESVDKLARVAPPVSNAHPRTKRIDKMICPECMNSFAPDEFVDVDGRKICKNCNDVLAKKSKKSATVKKDEGK
ncbi:MAG: hypothetical protein ACREJ2_12635 [Planctomycetota bacterium]